MSDVADVIRRMIRALCAENQSHMLKIIGLSSSAASVWKRRGKIPDGSIAKAAEVSGVSFNWIKSGEGYQIVDQVVGDDDEVSENTLRKKSTQSLQMSEEENRLILMYREISYEKKKEIYKIIDKEYWDSRKGNYARISYSYANDVKIKSQEARPTFPEEVIKAMHDSLQDIIESEGLADYDKEDIKMTISNDKGEGTLTKTINFPDGKVLIQKILPDGSVQKELKKS